MNKSIWYVGGKSAGHIMPLITLASKSNSPAVFITTHRALDKKIIHECSAAWIRQASDYAKASTDAAPRPARHSTKCEGWERPNPAHPERVEGLAGYHYPLYLPDIMRKKFWLYPWHAAIWLHAFAKLFFLFFKTRPEKIVSTGGLCAVPVFLFATVMRIPCELFELNATPGDAVKFLAPLSHKVYYCYKAVLTHLEHKQLNYKPYPVREFNTVSAHEARTRLKLDPAKKTICFLGGSQGSHFINDFALRVTSSFSPQDIQVIHQAGPADTMRLTAWYTEKNYTAFVIDYYAEIERLYAAADLVICRAGAGTLWELEYMNTPTCIIPLETTTTDHQLHNAQALCAQKPQQFFMLRQADADKNMGEIISVLEHQLLAPESQSPEDHQDLSWADQ